MVHDYGNELSNVFAMLHPSALGMIKHQLYDFQDDARDDGKTELVERATRAIEAVDIVIEKQKAR